MTSRTLTLPILMLAASAAVQAHTDLKASVPVDKSRVQAPAAIELHFSEAARLTALTLQKGTEAAQPVKPLPASAAAMISVPIQALTAGDYVVSWRVAGDDGHVMSGKFGFTVDPSAPASGRKKPAGAEDSHRH